MTKRLWGLTVVAVVLTWLTAESVRAEDIVFQFFGARSVPTGVVGQETYTETGKPFLLPANYGRLAESAQPPAAALRPSQDRTLPFLANNQVGGWSAGRPPATAWESRQSTNSLGRPLSSGESFAGTVPASGRPGDGSRGESDSYHGDSSRLPFAGTAHSTSGRPGDGSRREEGRHPGVHESGESFAGTASALSGRSGDDRRFENNRYATDSQRGQQWEYVKKSPVGRGTVYGRLTNRGRPLVNCRVTIVPMKKNGRNYAPDEDSQPLTLTTDDRGVYYFEDVPAGEYKLTWLPQGTNQWIRRISPRPDVTVRVDQTVGLKEIRVALQTIN